jgi:zinc protease
MQRAAPVATVMVTYHVGSRNETAGLTGATHFLEHLMFKGTPAFQCPKSAGRSSMSFSA